MLIIRSDQFAALAEPQIARYEQTALAHVSKYFAEQALVLGEEEILAGVRHGFKRAGQYGLETEKDLLRYLTLMFTFGRNFDTNPALPWASEILKSSDDGTAKTSRLQAKALANRTHGRGYREI